MRTLAEICHNAAVNLNGHAATRQAVRAIILRAGNQTYQICKG